MQDVAVVFRIVLVVVFLTSGIAKIRPSAALEQAVQQFSLGLAGPRLSRFVARVLPMFELVLALLLAAGWWLKAVAGVSTAMLLMFTAAMLVNLMRGKRIRCNCFGAASSAIGVGALSRNSILIIASFALLFESPWTTSVIEPLRADLQSLSDPTVIALLMAGIGLYAAILVLSEIDGLFQGTVPR